MSATDTPLPAPEDRESVRTALALTLALINGDDDGARQAVAVMDVDEMRAVLLATIRASSHYALAIAGLRYGADAARPTAAHAMQQALTNIAAEEDTTT